METDIWGQLALEASSVYVTDGPHVKRPFCDTVFFQFNLDETKSMFSIVVAAAWHIYIIEISHIFLRRFLASALWAAFVRCKGSPRHITTKIERNRSQQIAIAGNEYAHCAICTYSTASLLLTASHFNLHLLAYKCN